MAFLVSIVLLQLDMSVYRFENGYAEVWYQLPLSCFVDSQHLWTTADTCNDSYVYEFYIKNVDGTDSAYFEERKIIGSYHDNGDELIVDYFPLHLYRGRFQYTLHITATTGEMHVGGVIEVAPDTAILSCSDVILGHPGHEYFLFHDIPFLPSLAVGFIDQEVVFSYLEIYGLVPDSLYYEACYAVTDREGALIIGEKRACMKHDYVQVDTHSFQLAELTDGEYVYTVSISDPASQLSVARTANFKVRTVGTTTRGEFYREIQYLIDDGEYEYYQDLSETQKEVYLKEFWANHEYRQFEKRIREADEQFSVGRMAGRDSERGKLYILLGSPDEIETVPIAAWSRPFEIWRYYGKNDYLFCDIKNDHNPLLIRVLKPGEIERIIQIGFRDGTREEDWLSDIAPGTHDWHKDLESVE